MGAGHKDGGGFIGTSNDGGGGGWENLRLWSTNQWNNLTGKNSREAAKKAAQEADRKRRESIIKQVGVQEQADTLAYGQLAQDFQYNARPSGNKAPGVIGAQDAEGTIAANLNTSINSSGTF